MPRTPSDPPIPADRDGTDVAHNVELRFQELRDEGRDSDSGADPVCIDQLPEDPSENTPPGEPSTDGAVGRPCEACGATETAQERPVPLRTVACDQCWEQAVSFPDHEPAPPPVDLLLEQLDGGVPDPRLGTGTTCKHCAAACSWHRTVNGRWILIEPGDYPLTKVPPGKRWRIAGDGTAVNLGRAQPHDHCRISHFDICPAKPAPTDGAFLLALWRQHRKGTLTP